jgi:heme-degrading monooxygenase HmoA
MVKRALLLAVVLFSADMRAANSAKKAAVARQWHGKVASARAAEYEAYLSAAIAKFPSIKGNLGYEMLREPEGEVMHFSVISYWESREAIHAYAGEDISRVRALQRDPEFLIDPEATVRNYDLVQDARK